IWPMTRLSFLISSRGSMCEYSGRFLFFMALSFKRGYLYRVYANAWQQAKIVLIRQGDDVESAQSYKERFCDHRLSEKRKRHICSDHRPDGENSRKNHLDRPL